MFWRPKYFALATEETDGASNSVASLSNWFLLRRVRTALIASILLLLLGVTIFQYPHINQRVREYTQNVTAPALSTCNCATKESSNPPAGDDSGTTLLEPSIKLSDFAYVQYVTNPSYLCNSIMIFEALRRHNTKADLLMMYPEQWSLSSALDADADYKMQRLMQARDVYNVRMVPIQVKTLRNAQDPTWQDSYTKLLAFNQTQYKRVISIDSDGTVLDHMDELFP